MKHLHTLLTRAFLTMMLATAFGQAQAQVFIPDTVERHMLNTLIPGIVDGVGIMDTLNSGIASLDTVSLFIPYDDYTAPIEFIGLRYLHAMKSLSMSVYLDTTVSFSLNGLPSGLKRLLVYSFTSIDLNALPAGLQELWIGGLGTPGLTAHIATMPDSLESMRAMYIRQLEWEGFFKIGDLYITNWSNSTFTMPPSTIDSLYLATGGTVSVDLSAASIRKVFLSGNEYSYLSWPTGMTDLRIWPNYTPQLCLPWLPNTLTSLRIDAWTCIPNWPASLPYCTISYMDFGPEEVTYCSVLNTDCPGIGPGISGTVFIDQDNDGQYGPNDLSFPWASVVVDPNGYMVGCNSDGSWTVGVQPGNYTIIPASSYPYYQAIAPALHTASLPEMGDADTLNDFAVTLISGLQDLQAHLYAEPARPGFDNRLYLSCRNFGTVPMDAQLVLNYDAVQTWVGSSIAPSSQTGNTAVWNLPSMAVGATASLTVDLNTAASVPLGTAIDHMLSALPDADDETPSNNFILFPDTVVGSFDPNDKLLSPAVMSPSEVQANEKPITYTVRFQNTGTYMAERVVIVDTLPDGLRAESIRFLAGSHSYHWYIDHGVLYVLLENINLPDSSSDAANSQGFVSFSLLPDDDLTLGTTISNMAHIVFDFNTPITTPPAVFHVQLATAVSELSQHGVRVYPNPAQDRLWTNMITRSDAVNYVVKDLFGRGVLQGRMPNDGAVDVAGLPAGSYTITTFGSEGARTSRFVKL
ncbi:MAG: T9SS type A sorting domain-containing protein [Flavobacteriales bacterium]|jgi:uncharacterized repeat protein (TIGR01451 family)|nr:T9SS type A sorting domain-containing protein [Flavobacteriales bacterium]